MSVEYIIEVNSLQKDFSGFKALNGLDLQVKKGEVHGFLGPNGAGKSTTIRILLGLIKKTGGKIKLFGQDPWSDSVSLHKKLAYVPGDVNFWPNLSGGEIIELLGALRGDLNKSKLQELVKKFELDPKKKFRTYSKGNRQKVALVAALASDAELYVFDEPTSGLDPLMESIFQNEVRALKEQGKTVLLSSHILAEVESLCDSITIIRKGKTVESDDLSAIRKKHQSVFVVETKEDLSKLKKLKGLQEFKQKDGVATFQVDGIHTDKVLKELAKYKVESLVSQPPALEDMFLKHYE